jgi:glycogen debranching enzyme
VQRRFGLTAIGIVMHEIIRVEDQFYILATSSRVNYETRVLKHGDTFAVFDRFGDIQRVGLGQQGLYHRGTRYLSRCELILEHRRPILLSSVVKNDNSLVAVDLTNPDYHVDGQVVLPRDIIHMSRASLLWTGECHQRLRIHNYAQQSVNVSFGLHFDADFADVFEVRGFKREARGNLLQPRVESNEVVLSYEGLDGRIRETQLVFTPLPEELSASSALFCHTIGPHEDKTFYVTIRCDSKARPGPRAFNPARKRVIRWMREARSQYARIVTSSQQLNDWIDRSAYDLHMMVTDTDHGPYPYAGVPWFSTVFGRDGIITALQCLWVNPSLARGVLSCLAATQAVETIRERDAEPGKILHEIRQGEMAALGEIPFDRYYGSVDATPLFVMLAGKYYLRTGDRAFIKSIWPNILLALKWIDESGDADGDGFVEYIRQSQQGLVTQGWKDSFDSVFHADGELAEGPIALCEVQGYVFAAWRYAAKLALILDQANVAAHFLARSRAMQERFDQVFWCDELGTYALALDGHKRPCSVKTSNAGHGLFTGIVRRERAKTLARTLLHNTSFSGWGIRTVATTERRFNPMSYHNGSVWPHDNAIIAAGLCRYGLAQMALRLLTGLCDASAQVERHRLPELFCGFVRRTAEGPTMYPVACAPQSWAAGSVFMLLQSCLGLSVDATQRHVVFRRPTLPAWLNNVTIKNLAVGDVRVDLLVFRGQQDVGVSLTRRDGPADVIVVK